MSERRGRVAYLLGPERLEWRQEPVPKPGPGEALLRVGTAVTCGTDLKVYRQGGHARMLRPPSPFGHEVAGTIAALGEGDVHGWRVGDRVAVANSAPCGECAACAAGRENLCADLCYLNGAFADWLLVPARFVARSLHRVPDGMPFALAALAEPLACVLHGADVAAPARPRGGVLILGAGPIGLLWTGHLAAAGHDVLLADPNPERLAIGARLGATTTLAVERRGADEALRAAAQARGRAGFALAVDCTATPEGFASTFAALAPGGTLCAFAGPPPGSAHQLDLHRLHYEEIRCAGAYHYRPRDYAAALAELATGRWPAELMLSETWPLARLEEALARMAARRALKIALLPD